MTFWDFYLQHPYLAAVILGMNMWLVERCVFRIAKAIEHRNN